MVSVSRQLSPRAGPVALTLLMNDTSIASGEVDSSVTPSDCDIAYFVPAELNAAPVALVRPVTSAVRWPLPSTSSRTTSEVVPAIETYCLVHGFTTVAAMRGVAVDEVALCANAGDATVRAAPRNVENSAMRTVRWCDKGPPVAE